MKSKSLILALTFGLLSGLGAGFEGGSGTEGDPYQISTCQQLQDMENDLFSSYELVDDVNCSVTKSWDSGNGFSPIGDNSNEFYGSLNGNGYSISDFHIDRPARDYIGVLGYTADSGVIGNLTMNNVNVLGGSYTGSAVGLAQGNVTEVEVSGRVSGLDNVGGVVGYSGGLVIANFTSGEVSGNDKVGGLIGYDYGLFRPNSQVNRSYSGGRVTGDLIVGGLIGDTYGSEVRNSFSFASVHASSSTGGGLIGRNDGDIYDSYSTGSVTGADGIGGLIGSNLNDVFRSYSSSYVSSGAGVGGLTDYQDPGDASFTDSYWDINTTNISTGNGTGLTTSEMTGSAASSNMAGFDFQDTWSIQSFYYPRLQWMDLGSGTEADPFMIYNCRELQALNNDLLAHYELANDIDCSDSVNWNNGKGFYPIGDNDPQFGSGYRNESEFEGSFNGGNMVISNVYIDRPQGGYIGLFGDSLGIIENLEITNFDVTGQSQVGALLGASSGTVNNITSNSTVNGDGNTGGVIGYSGGYSAAVSGVNAESSVYNQDDDVGGIVGYMNRGFLINSKVTGDVYTESRDAGGVVGSAYQGAELINLSSNVDVEAEASWAGGILGESTSDGALINNSYALGNVTSDDRAGGAIGEISESALNQVYAVGKVTLSGFTSVNEGGLSGTDPQNEPVNQFISTYWDLNKTEQNMPYSTSNPVPEFFVNTTTSEMQGCNAESNLKGFDFENVWIAQQNDYPELRFFTSEGLTCETSNPPQPPTLLLPADGSTQVPVTTNLSVTAAGTGLQDITFYWNNSGADTEIGSVTDVNASNSEMAQVEWPGLNTSTTYEWYAVAENSNGSINSSNWNFTTEQRPVIDGFEPAHDSNTEPNPELKVNVSDDISDDIEVRFYSSSDQLLETASGLQSSDQAVYDPSLMSFGSTPGQTYEWYVVVETDSGASVNSSEASGFEDYWRFTPQSLISADIEVGFGDQVNMNNGSADIGRTGLEFKPWNPSNLVMDGVVVNVNGTQVDSFSDVASNSTQTVDISTLGLSEDQTYSWSVFVEDYGSEVGSFSGEFSTHTVDIEAVPQDDSHDSINLYYSEDGSSFSRLDSFSRSDGSSLSIKAANPELYRSNNHCYTAATSRAGLESSKSPEVCIGGDIP